MHKYLQCHVFIWKRNSYVWDEHCKILIRITNRLETLYFSRKKSENVWMCAAAFALLRGFRCFCRAKNLYSECIKLFLLYTALEFQKGGIEFCREETNTFVKSRRPNVVRSEGGHEVSNCGWSFSCFWFALHLECRGCAMRPQGIFLFKLNASATSHKVGRIAIETFYKTHMLGMFVSSANQSIPIWTTRNPFWRCPLQSLPPSACIMSISSGCNVMGVILAMLNANGPIPRKVFLIFWVVTSNVARGPR